MQSTSASFLSLITIGAFIAVAGFFLMGKILAGTAVITEFLLITGGADTIPTVAAVIGRSTGVGKSVLGFFFLHNDSPLLKIFIDKSIIYLRTIRFKKR